MPPTKRKAMTNPPSVIKSVDMSYAARETECLDDLSV